MRGERIVLWGLAGVLLASPAPIRAQDEIVVSFSDPSRPGTLNAQILEGSVTIRGYDGADVRIVGMSDDASAREVPERADGLRRILGSSGEITVSEANNVISIQAGHEVEEDLTIQVPFTTSLRLDVLDGDVEIIGVRGEIELNATDGDITLTAVSGPVLANAVDGDILATMAGTAAGDAPTSFSAVDGDIDLTLASDTAATLTMRALEGEIFTDLDVDLSGSEGGRPPGRGPDSRTLRGTINGGGIEFSLQTVDGDIFLRRGN